MSLTRQLMVSIERSQQAYELYSGQKLYHQASRIYNANTQVYELLQKFVFEANDDVKQDCFKYLFHLEDWFAQFNSKELDDNPKLEARFVFDRLEHGIAYPKDFYDKLKEIV